jgi:two-component system sensor histidine kinase UhpB
MSLRARILAAIVLVLASGAGFGLALAGWHARQWLREELTSAELSGRLTVRRAFGELRPTQDPRGELTSLVATFDGDRHVQAVLLAADGRVVAASTPSLVAEPPAWFSAWLRQKVGPMRLAAPTPGGEAIELRPVEANDMQAVWAEFLDLSLVLTLALIGGAALVFVVVGRALRPLSAVGQVLPRIGAGDYGARAPLEGPPELVALGRGVNEMAVRLGAMRERNRALEQQILTLQDEERADIARDLHDEIGPHLFAANLDAAMTASLISAGRTEEALAQVKSITAAIAHMQRLVRDILGRLRPTCVAELGLSSAVLDLIAFWRARRPDIRFETDLPEAGESLPEAMQETLYRMVQESLSNALRHGAPKVVTVSIRRLDGAVRAEVTNDGATAAPAAPGYGLTGMAERAAAGGGEVSAGPMAGGGWRVAATLPLRAQATEDAA